MQRKGDPVHSEGTFCVHSQDIVFPSQHRHEFATVTSLVEEVIKESGIKHGRVWVEAKHTTAGVILNEDEPNLVGSEEVLGCPSDMSRVLDGIAHPDANYGHNDVIQPDNPEGKRRTHLCKPDANGFHHECINGHSHPQEILTGHEKSIEVRNGKMDKGQWQEFMLVEFDHERVRRYVIQVMGIK